MPDTLEAASAQMRMISTELQHSAAGSLAETVALANHIGERLVRRVQAHASGRPGPRVITGAYLQSITYEVITTGMVVDINVGSNAPQAMRLEMGFVGVDSLGRHYCCDADTEIMTKRGWKRHDRLIEGEEVLVLHSGTWTTKWQPLLAIHRFEGNIPVSVIEGRTLSAATTDDHRWLIERFYGRGNRWVREWRTTATMPVNARIPLVQKCADLPYELTVEDDVVELAAWAWTEGHLIKSKRNQARPIAVFISQSPVANPDKCRRIENLLTRLLGDRGPIIDGHHWSVVRNKTTGANVYRMDRISWWLLREALDPNTKALQPAWLLRLTQSQLELLLEVSMLADGHTDGAGVSRLSQANEDRIRGWEMACVLAGQPVVTRYRSHHGFEGWHTTLLRTGFSHAFGSALRIDRHHVDERKETRPLVWCPTTEAGTWLARRKGTIYFTGNSQPPYPHFRPAADEMEHEFEETMAGAIALDTLA